MVRYEDALRCAGAFRAGRDLAIAFDAALLDRPNVLRPLAAFSPHRASRGEPRLAAVVPSDVELSEAELAEALRGIIGAAALGGSPALPYAAGTLGLSPRTLQRRLAGMGETWESLVDVWRRQTAEAMLADPACRVGTVARRLGYGDPAHFARAFRRWTGTTPTAWRRERVAHRPEAG
jgi:AraC-like DNA-binding protein